MKIVLFCYNFPHKKTQDFLHRLFVENADVVAVLSADPVPLNIPASAIRLKPRLVGLMHPRDICGRYGWRYEVVDHASDACARVIREVAGEVGIVAGARILKEPVLSAPTRGIVNFHPGLIPEVRGLDALQWAIYEGHAIGVTAHLIDQRVDAGRILLRQEIPLRKDDTLMEVAMRLQDIQSDLLPEVLSLLAGKKDVDSFPLVQKSFLHRKMPAELEQQIPALFERRLSQL
jgi:phosphoribosylglycinamide formyltransferase-1